MNFWKTFLAALLGCLVAMILNLILFFMLIGALMSAGASSESIPTVKNGSILKIDLSEAIGERTQEGVSADLGIPFLSMPKASLGIYDAIRSIEKAAEDNRVSMILITDKGTVNSGLSNLEELNALVKFHDCGKPIVAYGINYSLGGYYVASVADKVYIHNEGLMPIQGLGASMMFFKDALDKLGVEFQLIRHGKFKAAAEQYIKNDISPENRQQNMEMLNSIWECFSEAICKSRNLDPQVLNDAIDNLKIGTAKSAKEFNLVDETLTTDEYTQKICGLVGVEKEEDLNVITISNYAKSLGNKLKGDKKIAVLYAEGEIAMNGSGIAATKFVREVEKIRKDDKIDAVVFRVNSPGGDAQAAELMREALQKLAAEKPIVCSFGEYAASGGYWISAQAKHIFSDKTTLTGSIGVFSLAFNYAKGLKEHLKINEEEQAYTQTFIEQIYTKFMNIVSDGRNMTVAQVDSIAQGRVWTGTQGVQVGIVDEIGGIEDAIKYTANLVNASDYQVVEYPRVKTQMEMMMESFSGSGEETLLKKIFGKKNVSQAEQILKDIEGNNGVKTYVRMPYNYEFSY